jgi:hypothetical protein
MNKPRARVFLQIAVSGSREINDGYNLCSQFVPVAFSVSLPLFGRESQQLCVCVYSSGN